MSVARRKYAWLPGRFMTFTPMAMSARLLSHCARHQMAPIEQEEQRQGEQHVQPEQREPELPIIVPTQQPVQDPDRSGDHGGVLSHVVNGMSHPPKNSVVIRADAVTIFEYSAM